MASDSDSTRLDDAARAGWLYFVAGNTQEEIARRLKVSRQTAQRLVSLARSERLITFRLDHPIAACMELAQRIAATFGLQYCDVAPTDPISTDIGLGVGEVAASFLEGYLRSETPVLIAFGTGRTLRAAVDQVARMNCPHHRLVSLVGNISPEGAASFFDVLARIADLTRARHYPMPLPVFSSSVEEHALLIDLTSVRRIRALAAKADLALVGIGQIDMTAQIHQDGFVSHDELIALMRQGAVGEIVGWSFDARGRILESDVNARVTSVLPAPRPDALVVGVARGAIKVAAIRAALIGGLVNGLITDEETARALLADPI
ncbi:sugar-binding transcriptional regulator [Siculibacillus lacustris]|uniref:Sugar-binding transcriptional regulator n=1 Tax=Siculibacillus lacustris TaxID=1549641 RepID=A0A4Q9VM28_9HYPH|nr:sugar-binding transcriptional regulator [Siculibacillus lacustris]TBW36616.1 sugar-binding transcriptional regulator [Siculibacillus lacustris]